MISVPIMTSLYKVPVIHGSTTNTHSNDFDAICSKIEAEREKEMLLFFIGYQRDC